METNLGVVPALFDNRNQPRSQVFSVIEIESRWERGLVLNVLYTSKILTHLSLLEKMEGQISIAV